MYMWRVWFSVCGVNGDGVCVRWDMCGCMCVRVCPCVCVCVHTCAWVGWQWTLCHRILMMIIMSLRRDCPLNFAKIQGPPCFCGFVLVRDLIQFGPGTASRVWSVAESEAKSHLGQGSYRVGSGTKTHLGLGPSLYECVSGTVCKRAFESKVKLPLGQGSNRGWIWDQIAL